MERRESTPIRVLIIEDLDYEAELAFNQLKKAGLPCVSLRVETESALRSALRDFSPSVILSDFTLPQFDGLSALRISQEMVPDIPFIFVSGTIGEERAIEALRQGAIDYVLKTNMARLAPAVTRALEELTARKERARQEAQITRLNRVLRMLSGVNSLVVRIRDREELLRETCRLAVSVGGYCAAVAVAKSSGVPTIQPIAWSGTNEAVTDRLRQSIAEAISREDSLLDRVIRTGKIFVSNNTSNLEATATLSSFLMRARLSSAVVLPLLVDQTAIGALLLAAEDSDVVSDEELQMLREVAGNLSFALQYLQADTKVRFLSHFDPQTGLAKRALFCERLSRLIASPENHRSLFAVAVFDVERLTAINDSFGRRIGDLLLQHVADRMKRRFPETENIAHFGGGTFAIIRNIGTRSLDDVLKVAHEHVEAVFGDPFTIEQHRIPISIKTGFALYPQDGKDAGTLVQQAEAALRTTREAGERQLHYSAERHSALVSQLALEHKLRTALARNQFELHYQPKVNVITRRVQGVEALIRWRDPESGLVSPAAFLPLLESTGLIVDVGDWVIRQAALDAQAWLAAGMPPVRIAVNIAPMQLRLPDFAQLFLAAVKPWSTQQWGLDIEITEGALHDDFAAEVEKLKLLRSAGVKIAIDDFGTGYSSLSRLSSLPIDTLKVDRSFVSQTPGSLSGRTLVKTIISLAKAFNMLTVAEGVETQEQLEFLRQAGCDQSQGYLHSKPVPRDEFRTLLQHGRDKLILAAEPANAAAMVNGPGAVPQ